MFDLQANGAYEDVIRKGDARRRTTKSPIARLSIADA